MNHYQIAEFVAFLEQYLVPIVGMCALLIGWGSARWYYRGKWHHALHQLEQTTLQLQTETYINAERQRIWIESHNNFAHVSEQALRTNNEQFLQLAQETLKRFHSESQSDLTLRQQSIAHLVEPIQIALAKTEQHIQDIERDRHSSFDKLSEQIRLMLNDQVVLRQETGRLATALRTPSVRGQWGELSLRRIVEMAGMNEHCDFVEQQHFSNEERVIRPDLIIRMPDSRELIIDAKTPMDGYLDAVNATSEEQRKHHLGRHAKHMREHVRKLAARRYWEQFENAPDFVVLFIPGEQFLGAALSHDKNLLQDALTSKVILATPTTLIALLRSVAYGWKQTVLAENANKIRGLGEDLHKRLSIFIEHLEKIGKNLSKGVELYNNSIGSLERNVLPAARRLEEYGASSERAFAPLNPIQSTVRATVVNESVTNCSELDSTHTSPTQSAALPE